MRLWILHCRILCLKSAFFQPAWFLMIMGILDGFPWIPGKLATKNFTWQTSRCLRYKYEELYHLNHQYLGMVIQFSNLSLEASAQPLAILVVGVTGVSPLCHLFGLVFFDKFHQHQASNLHRRFSVDGSWKKITNICLPNGGEKWWWIPS